MRKVNKRCPFHLVEFKEDISEGLIQNSTKQKKSRPSESPQNSTKKSKKTSDTPAESVRFDQFSPFPEYSEKLVHCKVCIKLHTKMKCSKCYVGLYFTKDCNYFTAYHFK